MQLIDKDDNVGGGDNLCHDRFQSFLELTAVFGSGHQRGHIECDHALVLKRLRHLVLDNALRQTFGDSRLAYARFTDQNRIVLFAAGKNLRHPLDLVITTDNRVQLAPARQFRQVPAEMIQGRRLGFFAFFLERGRLAALDVLELLVRFLVVDLVGGENLGGDTLFVFKQGQKNMFGVDILGFERPRFLTGNLKRLFGPRRQG